MCQKVQFLHLKDFHVQLIYTEIFFTFFFPFVSLPFSSLSSSSLPFPVLFFLFPSILPSILISFLHSFSSYTPVPSTLNSKFHLWQIEQTFVYSIAFSQNFLYGKLCQWSIESQNELYIIFKTSLASVRNGKCCFSQNSVKNENLSY